MKILILDDQDFVHKTLINSLKSHLRLEMEILSAFNLTQARTFFVDNVDIGMVVVDGSLGAGENGLDFIKEIRAQFQGKIVAASGDSATCRAMVEAGADLTCRGDKFFVVTIIKDALAPQSH